MPQLIFLSILAVTIALLVTERLRTDLVAVLVIIALAATHLLSPEQALSGFASEPAAVIAGMFVLSAAMHRTGLSDLLGAWIGRLAGQGLVRMLAVIMPAVALLSAFTHHVTITAIMLPVMLTLSRERGLPASKLLMPMAIASSLGTTITILGAPAFLVTSELLRQAGRPGLGVFSIAPFGLSLSLVGTLFMLVLGRWLLPSRRGSAQAAGQFGHDGYFTELTILPDSPLLNRTAEEVEADGRYNLNVLGRVRRGRHVPFLSTEHRLRKGDVLLVRTSPDAIATLREAPGIALHPQVQYEAETSPSSSHAAGPPDSLVQAIIGPDSDLVGHTLSELDFRRHYGALVLSLWRQQPCPPKEMAHVELCAGDVLVLQGPPQSLARLANDPNFLLLVPFQGEARRHWKALVAGGIMLATIAAAAFDWLSLSIAALAGATAMVLSGCLTPQQAYRAIDRRMYVFVAGAIPLGTAMKSSGTAGLLAHWLQGAVRGWQEPLVLLALFATVAVVVQFMGSDAATTALFGPMAIALAQALGQPPEAYAVTVAMAAVTAILTPMSHHNLLIYAPGGYRFSDFFRVGAPLTALVGVVVAVLASTLWR